MMRTKLEWVMLAARIWLAARRYRSQLDALVRHRLDTQVVGELGGNFPQSMESLVAGLAMDFPSEIRGSVHERGVHLEAIIREEAMVAISQIRDEIELRTGKLEDLQSNLVDHRHAVESGRYDHSSPEPPPTQAAIREQYRLAHVAEHVLSALAGFRIRAILTFLLAGGISALEAALVYLTLEQAFFGVQGLTSWILPTQTLLLTVVMLYTAHAAQSGKRRGFRWLAGATLCVITLILAFLRVGVIAFKSGGTVLDSSAGQLESLGFALLIFLAALWVAVLGADAVRRAKGLLDQARRFWEKWRQGVSDIQAQLDAHKMHQSNRRRHRRDDLEFRKALQPHQAREVIRLENEIRSEQAATRQLVHKETSKASSRLAGEISNASRQLARWYYRSFDERRAFDETAATKLAISGPHP